MPPYPRRRRCVSFVFFFRIAGQCTSHLCACRVKAAGVKVVVSLQDDVDLENQKIDLKEVAVMLSERDVRHLQIPTSDADESELRTKLPGAVAKFAKEVSSTSDSEGVYIHCNGGRGRAPTIVSAYYFWLGGLTMKQAVEAVQNARASKPKVDVIVGATADMLAASDASPSAEIEDLTTEERALIKSKLEAMV